jgi:hypothetical protein
MIRPVFLLFELMTYGLFIACLWRASKQGRSRVIELIFGLIYGVLLEWMTLRQLNAYEYGQFAIMIDGAPLCIGMGWAVIIYSAMEFTNRLQLPMYARPLVDGFLALGIDLAMDAVAIRLGFWTWGVISIDQEWFGVPWGNFWAWFIVVSSFAAFLRAFRAYRWHEQPLKSWLYVPFAFMLSIIILAATNHLYSEVLWPAGFGFGAMLVLLICGVIVIWQARPKFAETGPPDPVVFAVPLLFHIFFNAAGIIYGFYVEQPIIGIVGIGVMLASLGIHLWPWWQARQQQNSVTATAKN